MSDTDLDKYLEGIGIDVESEEESDLGPLPMSEEAEPEFEIETLMAGQVVTGTPPERAESFLVNLLLNIDPSYAVEIETFGDEVHAEIYGGDPGRLIGRNGRTLAALEFVTNSVVNAGEGDWVRVNVDVGGYKQRRDDRLRREAHAAATRARRSGKPAELKPMSAAERRVVHMTLADEPGVTTESRGEGTGRRVVVRPT